MKTLFVFGCLTAFLLFFFKDLDVIGPWRWVILIILIGLITLWAVLLYIVIPRCKKKYDV